MTHPKKDQLLNRLAGSREELLAVLDALDGEAWSRPVFSDGDQWTVLDLVRHLLAAERGTLRLMESVRAGGAGASPDFDLARWNAAQVRKQAGSTPADALRGLAENRAAVLAFVETLQPEDWEKAGAHGSGNVLTIYGMLRIIGLHEKDHLRDIRLALGAGQ